jgi:type II restriction enzyme
MFTELIELISKVSSLGFAKASLELFQYIDTTKSFTDVLSHIGTIPESIGHDSTEEKLFAKTSDAALSRAFREIGLKSCLIKARANSADAQAESPIHGYTLVADAKAFRMTRTAKNQKDYKIAALSGWRHGSEYAVLCAPFFHYPKTTSQIYAQ